MEAEKPHNLLSTTWSCRKASGVAPVHAQRPENREHASSGTAEEKDVIAQAERVNSPFLLLFVLIRPSMVSMMLNCMGEGGFLPLVYQFIC